MFSTRQIFLELDVAQSSLLGYRGRIWVWSPFHAECNMLVWAMKTALQVKYTPTNIKRKKNKNNIYIYIKRITTVKYRTLAMILSRLERYPLRAK